MRYIFTLLIVLVVGFVVLLVEFNQGAITINLTPSKSFEVTRSTFFLISLEGF